MKIEISVPEVMNMIKEIQTKPEQIFEMIRVDVRKNVGAYISELMETELTHFLGRERYEHGQGEVNHRNGTYHRNFTLKGIGGVNVQVPRDRQGEYKTDIIPRSKQYEEEIRQDLSMMFLTGMSTRSLSMMSKKLLGTKISHGEISRCNKELIDAAEQWRNRALSKEKIKYLFLDGVNFDMRIDGSIEKVPVLVAIGVREDNQKLVLGFQSGDKESAPNWREFFKDLKKRGLDGSTMLLGIMDGLPGLEKVFKEEFPRAKVQRCQVHVARNVLAKVPKKLKKVVADEMRSIFYASSKPKAMEFFHDFKNRWEKEIPSAVKCLGNSIESCLTFFDCPEQEWISLRTTNIIERLNKEFKKERNQWRLSPGRMHVICSWLL
jgi:putative transposase